MEYSPGETTLIGFRDSKKLVIRTVTNSKYNAHCDPLFKHLSLLKAYDIHHINQLKFSFKYINNTLPAYFENMFKNIHLNHNYETRNRDRALPNIARTVSST